MVAWNLVMSIGIGLAFAAMPNLIIDAVPPEETGQATGVNALVRSVGASLGSQVTAAVLAGSVVAGRAPDRQRLHRRRSSSAPASRSLAAITAIADPEPQRPHGPRRPRHAGGLTWPSRRRAARAPTRSATARG